MSIRSGYVHGAVGAVVGIVVFGLVLRAVQRARVLGLVVVPAGSPVKVG